MSPRGDVDESLGSAECWVLGVQSSRIKPGRPQAEESIARFLWMSEGDHWEAGSTPGGPLNPRQAFLLSFLGEGTTGLGTDEGPTRT